MLHQVQDDSLATQQNACVMADHGQHLALVDPHAIKNLRMADDFKARMCRRPRIEPGKDLQQSRDRSKPGHHQVLACNNRRRSAQVRVDGNVGCRVAHRLVFHQGLFKQCVDAVTLPVHSFFPRCSGPRVRFICKRKL